MVAGQIQAMDPYVVVLHNMISSAYKEEKAKSLLPASHFRSLVAHQWSMRGAIFMSAVIEHLAGWRHRYCKEMKKWVKVQHSEAVFKLQISFNSSI